MDNKRDSKGEPTHKQLTSSKLKMPRIHSISSIKKTDIHMEKNGTRPSKAK